LVQAKKKKGMTITQPALMYCREVSLPEPAAESGNMQKAGPPKDKDAIRAEADCHPTGPPELGGRAL